MTRPDPALAPPVRWSSAPRVTGQESAHGGLCRLLAEAGYRVAPFKAQNMALNSFVTSEGGEIGRAQVAQAEARGIDPRVDMNLDLAQADGGVSQVIVEGHPIGVMSAREYYAEKERLWPRVTASYDRLAHDYERIVLEGAGSPVEINLTEHDLTNLQMAHYADAAVILVADIERGGVFAQLIGTWELLEPRDRPGWSASLSINSEVMSLCSIPAWSSSRPAPGCRCWECSPIGPTCRSTRKTPRDRRDCHARPGRARAPATSTSRSPACPA